MVTFLCLFEEPFLTSNKYSLSADAMDTVLINIGSLERAWEFEVGHVE